VAVVSHYAVFGGPHNVAMRVNAALAPRGWQVIVLMPDDLGNAAERLRAGGVSVFQIPLHRARKRFDPRLHAAYLKHLPGEIGSIQRFLREQRVEAVMMGGYLNPHEAIAARREGVPIVWQVANVHSYPFVRPLLIRMVEHFADSIMFTGERLRRLYLGSRRAAVQVFPFYPPVDTDLFCPSQPRRAEVRARLNIPSGAPVVGTVGNLNAQKGMEYWVRAAAMIYRRHRDTHFVIVGATLPGHEDYAALVDREVRNSGIPSSQFIFTGSQSDTYSYYAAMDVMLVASRYEGIATTALEALSSGLPVVATDVGGMAEAVRNDETGFVVPPRDPQALAGAVITLIGDSVLRRSMSEQARRDAVERFDVRVCGEAHRQAFKAAIARRELMRASG
jgi:glycosyltransferase involved in cell wall biosynthesis